MNMRAHVVNFEPVTLRPGVSESVKIRRRRRPS